MSKYACPCGSEVTKGYKSEHEKTKKHQAWLKDQEQTAETVQVLICEDFLQLLYGLFESYYIDYLK